MASFAILAVVTAEPFIFAVVTALSDI